MSRGSDSGGARAARDRRHLARRGGARGKTPAGDMNSGASAPPNRNSSGDSGGVGAPSVRELKLQLFYRLQARGPRGAWTQYWTAFQRFLAARIALEEFHALALELLGEDMHLHNRFVVALLGVAHGGQGSGGAAASVEGPSVSRRPEVVMQQVQTNGGRELTGQEAATNGTQPHRQTVSSGSPVRIKREPDDVASDHHRHRHHDRHHHHSNNSHHKHENSHHRRHYSHHSQEYRPHSHERGHYSQEPKQELLPDLQQQQQLQAGSRKRSFSSITTAGAGAEDNAVNKLLHFASSSHDAHHADDDHQSAKLLIGLGQANALISPLGSDGERSQRSTSPEGSDNNSATDGGRDGDSGGGG